jgi:Spirocyclase AveC-like
MSAISHSVPSSVRSSNQLQVMRSTPAVYWAALGAAFLCLAAYVWGSWILSPDFRPSPVGLDPLPHNVWLSIRIVETIASLTIIGMLGIFVIRPLMKTGEIALDGMLVINFLLMWWTDPIDNYINFSFMYNGYAVNMGGWANHIPGWSYPNHQNLPEPLLLMGGFYIGFSMINALLGCWVLRKTTELWPTMKMGWRITILFAAFAVIDTIVENAIMRTGIAAYPGVVRSVTLFPGEVYQWPLYEAGIIAFVNTGFTSLRYFKDDRGQTFVEKGIDNLRLSGGRRKALTFFALAGFIQPFFLIGYYLPYNLFVVHADTFPAYPSYMRSMICGEGTQYACPSDGWVPIPHRESKLFVAPDDPRLPQEVRDAQGITASGRDPYASK